MFTRSGTTWSQQAYVKASNADTGDLFGTSVAFSADGSTLAIGAGFEASAATGIGGNQADNSADNAGAAYVFTRGGTTSRQQAYVKAFNTDAGDEFGYSVALSADSSTLAVGAYLEASAATGIGGNQANNYAASAGAVYVYRLPDQQSLKCQRCPERAGRARVRRVRAWRLARPVGARAALVAAVAVPSHGLPLMPSRFAAPGAAARGHVQTRPGHVQSMTLYVQRAVAARPRWSP